MHWVLFSVVDKMNTLIVAYTYCGCSSTFNLEYISTILDQLLSGTCLLQSLKGLLVDDLFTDTSHLLEISSYDPPGHTFQDLLTVL